MKTLIFNGSPRKNGGTAAVINILRDQIAGEINVVESYRTEISPCVDCRFCWNNTKCAIDDEMQRIYQMIDEADNIIIASPIYFGELTGSLLSLMSRLQYFYAAKKFRKTEVLSPKKRKGALILVDGGDGYTVNAMAMGKTLLRKMKTEFSGMVYFSGTDNLPKCSVVVPEKIINDVKILTANLNK